MANYVKAGVAQLFKLIPVLWLFFCSASVHAQFSEEFFTTYEKTGTEIMTFYRNLIPVISKPSEENAAKLHQSGLTILSLVEQSEALASLESKNMAYTDDIRSAFYLTAAEFLVFKMRLEMLTKETGKYLKSDCWITLGCNNNIYIKNITDVLESVQYQMKTAVKYHVDLISILHEYGYSLNELSATRTTTEYAETKDKQSECRFFNPLPTDRQIIYRWNGECRADDIQGLGELIGYKNNQEVLKYEGYIELGRMKGFGSLTVKDYAVFNGFFYNNLIGETIVNYYNGEFYKGELLNLIPNGKGKFIDINNFECSGEFKDGKPFNAQCKRWVPAKEEGEEGYLETFEIKNGNPVTK